MEQQWLNNLERQSAVLVPTRSLATALHADYSEQQIALGRTVWESPNILVWADYYKLIWQINRSTLAPEATLIDPQKSLLLWAQVIELTRRQERELTLLNVRQTSRAAQRSWRLINDWCLNVDQLQDDHVADIDKFIEWIKAYQAMLEKRRLIDEPTLLSKILQSKTIKSPFKNVVWHSFDLISDAQQRLMQLESACGVRHEQSNGFEVVDQESSYERFLDTGGEIRTALQHARTLIETQPESKINVVIPDLQQKYAQVQEIARDVFYPNKSPLDVHLSDTVYRFSLGQPMADWPAIESALSAIKTLRNSIAVSDLCLMLRNRYLAAITRHPNQARKFERWLKKQRLSRVRLTDIPSLIEQCFEKETDDAGSALYDSFTSIVDARVEIQQLLDSQKENTNFAAIGFDEWVQVFENWLHAWGWRISIADGSLNTKDYQLQERWKSFLNDFSSMSVVQSNIGLSKAIEILNSAANDAIFLPKAAGSPILISGIYEAIGQKADVTRLLGMSQNFPPSAVRDAFIPNRVLMDTGFPDASPTRAYAQTKQVIASLLRSSQRVIVSYALSDDNDVDMGSSPSAIFRDELFSSGQDSGLEGRLVDKPELEIYQDVVGPAWLGSRSMAGGTSIFEHQSNCAFKAFVTHQLGFNREVESEFGLDSLDRGTVVHRLLEIAWGELQTSDQLERAISNNFPVFLDGMLDRLLADTQLKLNGDKSALLKLERTRLKNILAEWLTYELKRPSSFAVLEREQRYEAEIGGIEFTFVIDRLDATDDGRTIIIDYKTGATSRQDWLDERIAKPQLPLYAVALDKKKAKPISGFSYAKIDAKKMEFQELAETDIVKPESNHYARRYAEQWSDAKTDWPNKLEQLATEFLSGDARVNPIEEKTCAYCDLSSICRVSQLRHQSRNSPSKFHANTLAGQMVSADD